MFSSTILHIKICICTQNISICIVVFKHRSHMTHSIIILYSRAHFVIKERVHCKMRISDKLQSAIRFYFAQKCLKIFQQQFRFYNVAYPGTSTFVSGTGTFVSIPVFSWSIGRDEKILVRIWKYWSPDTKVLVPKQKYWSLDMHSYRTGTAARRIVGTFEKEKN